MPGLITEIVQPLQAQRIAQNQSSRDTRERLSTMKRLPPAVAPDYRETSTGTDICASKVRVVPPSKRCLKRAWL